MRKSKSLMLMAFFLILAIGFQTSCKKDFDTVKPVPKLPTIDIWYSVTLGGKKADKVKGVEGAVLAGSTVYFATNDYVLFWIDPSQPANWALNSVPIAASIDQIGYKFTTAGTYTLTVTSPTGAFAAKSITIIINASGQAAYNLRISSNWFDFAADSFRLKIRFPLAGAFTPVASISDSLFTVSEAYGNGFAPKFANVTLVGTDSADMTLSFPQKYVGCAPIKFDIGGVCNGHYYWFRLDPTSSYCHTADSLPWINYINGSPLVPTGSYTGVPGAVGDALTLGLPIARFTVLPSGATTTLNPMLFHLPTPGAVLTVQYKTLAGGIWANMVTPTAFGNTCYWLSGGVTIGNTSGNIWFRILENGVPSQFMTLSTLYDAGEGGFKLSY